MATKISEFMKVAAKCAKKLYQKFMYFDPESLLNWLGLATKYPCCKTCCKTNSCEFYFLHTYIHACKLKELSVLLLWWWCQVQMRENCVSHASPETCQKCKNFIRSLCHMGPTQQDVAQKPAKFIYDGEFMLVVLVCMWVSRVNFCVCQQEHCFWCTLECLELV